MKAVGKYIVITEIKEQHKTDSGNTTNVRR